MLEQAPGRRGTHTGAGFLAACGGTMLKVPLPDGLHLLETIRAEAVVEELQPVGKTHLVFPFTFVSL